MTKKICNRWTGEVMFEADESDFRAKLEEAVRGGVEFHEADFHLMDLCRVNLSGGKFHGADFSRSDLERASLSNSAFYKANFECANLREADLHGANFTNANFQFAALIFADLSDCKFDKATFLHAMMAGVKVSSDLLLKIVSERTIVPEGDLIGWKKLKGNTLCKIRIPAAAGRVGGVIGRKCRAEFAEVLAGEGCSTWDELFYYKPGQLVRAKSFDQNPFIECSAGIHFFITRQEAEAY